MRSNYPNVNPMQQMMQAFQQFQQNPAGFMRQMGVNVPNGMSNPTQIWNWMQQSGAISHHQMQQLQQAQRSASSSPIFMQYFGKR